MPIVTINSYERRPLKESTMPPRRRNRVASRNAPSHREEEEPRVEVVPAMVEEAPYVEEAPVELPEVLMLFTSN